MKRKIGKYSKKRNLKSVFITKIELIILFVFEKIDIQLLKK